MSRPMSNRSLAFLATAFAICIALVGVAAAAPGDVTLTTVSPAPGATLSGVTNWQVSPSDSSKVNRIEFSIDGSLRWREFLSPYQFNGAANAFDTSILSDGSHQLRAVAVLTDGSTVVSQLTVSVGDEVRRRRSRRRPLRRRR